jgi:hypothetical protein
VKTTACEKSGSKEALYMGYTVSVICWGGGGGVEWEGGQDTAGKGGHVCVSTHRNACVSMKPVKGLKLLWILSCAALRSGLINALYMG